MSLWPKGIYRATHSVGSVRRQKFSFYPVVLSNFTSNRIKRPGVTRKKNISTVGGFAKIALHTT